MHYYFSFFFFNDTATTEIYTLSVHDALPIYGAERQPRSPRPLRERGELCRRQGAYLDRKSTRLNSSHSQISYAVFCLKKKKHQQYNYTLQNAQSPVHVRPLISTNTEPHSLRL